MIYNSCNIRYIFCNKPWLFLSVKCLKINLIHLLGIKTYSSDETYCHLFYTQSSYHVQYLFSTTVTTSYQFKSSIRVFKKKQRKWNLPNSFFFFFMSESPVYRPHQFCKISHTRKYFPNCSFFASQIFVKEIFYTARSFLYQLKILVLPLLLLK